MNAPFDDPATAKIWNSYFAEFDRLSAPLGEEGRELRSDLERHVLESLQAISADGDLIHQLEDALQRLGRPIEYLRPVLGEHHILNASRTYNPVAVGKGLFHTILGGGGRVLAASVFALGYLLIVTFAVMAISKPFLPEKVGLWRAEDGTISAGVMAQIPDGQELLGWWATPVALALAALIYIVLTKGMRKLLRQK